MNQRSLISCARLLSLGLLIFLLGCQPVFGAAPAVLKPSAAPALSFSGQGPGEVALGDWKGPAVLHLTASEGSQPFRAETVSGLDTAELIQSASSGGSANSRVDEYRGIVVDPAAKAKMQINIQGDRSWKVDLYPADDKSFVPLKVPGTYKGQGNSVIYLEGKHGVATFQIDRAEGFEAWAIGESQIWERLTITPDGDYKGKSVLPPHTRLIVVSARGPWSVNIPGPCCELNPNNKDK